MKTENLKLSKTDREYLEKLLRKGQLPARTYKRVMGLLELDSGKTFENIAQTLRVSRQSVNNWRNSYQKQGLKCLQEKARSGRPTEIDVKQQARIAALAASPAPKGYPRWNLRLLAVKAVELGYCQQISHSQVGKILKKTNSLRVQKDRSK